MTKKYIEIYDFEGRYEKHDENGFRWFEISQLKNNQGFLIIGVKFNLSAKKLENFSKLYKVNGKVNPLERAMAFLETKLNSGYKQVGIWNQIEHPKYHYPNDLQKTHNITILKSNLVLNPIPVKVNKLNIGDLF